MARVFITGSSDGIGLHAAQRLIEKGHRVTLHARNEDRAADTRSAAPGAEEVLIADLRSISAIKQLADDANATGTFDAIIHNAGIGYGGTSSRETTSDGISAVFSVNTLAPYILTCLMEKPKSRILFMSSDSHYGGDETLKKCTTSHSYGNSKLHDVMLANAFARRWSDVQSVSMHPGWVRTKMGGAAPGTTDEPAKVLAEWAVGEGSMAKLPSGAFFTTSGQEQAHSGAGNVQKQEELLSICKEVSGVEVSTTLSTMSKETYGFATKKGVDWSKYTQFRPAYPKSYFDDIFNYHSRKPEAGLSVVHDVGAGAGIASAGLAQRFDKVIVSDPNEVYVSAARQNLIQESGLPESQFVFLKETAEASSVEAGSVDFITACESILYTDVAVAFEEFHRQLRPGGTFMVSYYTRPPILGNETAAQAWNSLFQILSGKTERHASPGCGSC
ncbi:hypothetical protein PRZ48_006743 [Zasmidium cellare]|uniref:Methyltransferase type 11 domain-containing protein n=1 Tax=Zasmidium cellare TaxID=395010 RepID=A0ABR0EP96_ZASCE|nr:hypothetical protein PRZ48_006743 [Zasmidium cellare]